MLLTVEGTYQNGQIRLDDEVPFKFDKKVIVTFLNDTIPDPTTKRLTTTSFSFAQTREVFSQYTGSFSDEVINERRTS